MIDVSVFKGMAPRVSPGLLEPQQGVSVTGRATSGELRPWQAAHKVADCAADTQGIYKTDTGDWLAFSEPVSMVQSPNANDAFGRLYYTRESGGLFVVSPLDGYVELMVGVPKPPLSPDVTVSGEPTDPESTIEDRVYVITYVNDWGEEGPPSDPTDFYEWQEGQTVTLSNFPVPPIGFKEVVAIRIYRMAVGDNLAEWFFVDEIMADTATYEDTVGDILLIQGTLSTSETDLPQLEGRGLTAMGGGVFATFEGNELAFSEPFLPYSWPDGYRLSLAGHVVALGFAGGVLVVLTTRHVWLVYGGHPESYALSRQTEVAPCISPRGVVSTEMGVLFPAPDGLRAVTGNSPSTLLTHRLCTSKEWVALFDPLHLTGAYHSGIYYGFHPLGGFALDMRSEVLTQTDALADAVFVDGLSLYFAANGSILEWDAGGGFLRARFLSKVFTTPKPVSLSAARVDAATDAVALLVEAWIDQFRAANLDMTADGGEVGGVEVGGLSVAGDALHDPLLSIGDRPVVRMMVFADGLKVFEQQVPVGRCFRLPGGFLAREWQFFVETPAPLKRVSMNTSVRAITG